MGFEINIYTLYFFDMAKEEPTDDGFIGGASKLSSPAGSNRVIFASGSANSLKTKFIKDPLGKRAKRKEKRDFIFIYGADEAVVVKDDDVRMSRIEGHVPHARRTVHPLQGQVLGQLLGKRRVTPTAHVVLHNLLRKFD